MLEQTKDLAPWVIAIISLLALAFNIYFRKKDLEIKLIEGRYKPRLINLKSDLCWTGISRKGKPKTVIRVVNRDDRDIVIQDISWALMFSNTTWDIEIVSEKFKNISELLPVKLKSADYIEFYVDLDKVFLVLWLNRVPAQFSRVDLISRLRIRIELSTGESPSKLRIATPALYYLIRTKIKYRLFRAIGYYYVGKRNIS